MSLSYVTRKKQTEKTSTPNIMSTHFLFYKVQGSVPQTNSGSSQTAKAFRIGYCTLPPWHLLVIPWVTCQYNIRESAACAQLHSGSGDPYQILLFILSLQPSTSYRKISKNDLPPDQKTFQNIKQGCVLVLYLPNF